MAICETLAGMEKAIRKAVHGAFRFRKGRSRKVGNATFKHPPPVLASLIRGLYRRVARKLRVDPSYVSRVARSERHSKAVESEIRRQLREIVKYLEKQRNKSRKQPARKKAH